MIIFHLCKFLHILVILGLFGTTLYGCVGSPQSHYFNRSLLFFSLFALLSGTGLVALQYHFHTPWIQAAYLLLAFYSLSVVFLCYLEKKSIRPIVKRIIYFILVVVLFLITHDAVTKTTYIYSHSI